ncbi:MAG: arginine-tRNA-protein transferase [Verrucomicrobia bacterium]|nr:arginine-tRNA-protein transferase [Verrucomicrobiota bacterium]
MDQCPEPAADATGNCGPPAKIEEAFFELQIEPARLDDLLAQGWRHFGPYFFRYSQQLTTALQDIIPLRVDLTRFRPSKSQRRVLRRNADVTPRWQTVSLTEEHHTVFAEHAGRFAHNVPGRLEDFLGPWPQLDLPCRLRELSVRDATGRLLAASYVAQGARAWSSVYAFFAPSDGARSLGIATQLWEIEAARAAGCRWLYLGYATRQPSHYDYKRQFAGTEWFDWERWQATPIPSTPADV